MNIYNKEIKALKCKFKKLKNNYDYLYETSNKHDRILQKY